MRTCLERQRIYDGARVEQYICFYRSDPSRFTTEASEVSQENGDVIVGIRTRVATRARSKQNDALKAFTVDRIEGRPESCEDRIIEARHVDVLSKTAETW